VTLKTRLLQTPYCTIDWDRRNTVLRLTRSSEPYPSSAAIEQEGDEIERILDKFRRCRLLIDLRAAAPRDDPEFESAIARYRQKIFKRADRAAILVRTAVGALQVKRHMREGGFNVNVFQNEEDAFTYLDTVQSVSGAHSAPTTSTSLPRIRRRTD
jgi:hypothetical protein